MSETGRDRRGAWRAALAPARLADAEAETQARLRAIAADLVAARARLASCEAELHKRRQRALPQAEASRREGRA